VQQGHPTDAPQTTPQDTKPHPQMEAGLAEDMFVVFEGHVDGLLDRAPAWRDVSKDGLRSPNVPAVAEFRKIIEESEKQKKGKP